MSFEALLYLLAFGGLLCFFNIRQATKEDKSGFPVRWWEAILVAVFLYYGGQILGTIAASIIGSLQGLSEDSLLGWLRDDVLGRFWLILFIEAITIGLLWAFMRSRKMSWKSIGLFGRPQFKDLGLVIIGFAVYFLLYIAAVTIIKAVIPALDVDQEQQIGFQAAAGLALVPVFISLVILPPVTEEIIARGFLYSGLRTKFMKWGAAVITSAMFGLAHLQAGTGEPLLWIAAIDTFVLSVVLIELRERSGGKLWAPIGLHALKNGIAFVSIFILQVAR